MLDDRHPGWRRLDLADRFDPVVEGFAPVLVRRTDDGGLLLGFRVAPRHCNPSRRCHGGTWATMADVLMGLNVGLLSGMSGPTVSMALDFAGEARCDQWVEGRARLLRHTHRLGFVDCLFTVDGEPAVRANAVYRRCVPLTLDLAALVADDPHGNGDTLPERDGEAT